MRVLVASDRGQTGTALVLNDPLGDVNPAVTYSVNRSGTLHLAQAAETAGARAERFMSAFSCSFYGASPASS